MRVGIGYDAHRLVEGSALVLGGVAIPFEKGLRGYSDSDVLAHAIIDALLGAAKLGDIGTIFPDSDPQYENIYSIKLLHRTAEMLKVKGIVVENVDATIIAEAPQLTPYKDEMCRNIAQAIGIDPDRISVKATTTEGLGAPGRGEGITAMAIVLLSG